MSDPIGVDLGSTLTAAAVSVPDRVEPAPLGAGTAFIPTVAAVTPEGSLVFGEEAVALGRSSPVVRQFIRRIGDDTPLLLGGVSVTAEALAARLTSSVVDTVAARSGEPAERVAITYPASWGSYRVAALRAALAVEGLEAAVLLSGAQASALAYADQTPVADGDLIAVYDLGGSGLDAAVVRRSADEGFVLAGRAEEAEVGGLDFDELVFEYVRTALGEQWTALDGDDPAVLAGVAALRSACTAAKERLSTDTETWIPVAIPGVDAGTGGAVRLVRAELEEMIRPAVEETAAVLLRAINSAGVEPGDLAAVLLTGGSARIPVVTQVVSEVLGRPVTVAENPKADTAAGAALAAAGPSATAEEVSAGMDIPVEGALVQTLTMPRVELEQYGLELYEDGPAPSDVVPPPPPRTPVVIAPMHAVERHHRRFARRVLAGCGVVLAVLLLGGWMWSANTGGPPGAGADVNHEETMTPASPSSKAPERSSAPAGPRSAARPRTHPSTQPATTDAPSPARSKAPTTAAPPPTTTIRTPSSTPSRTPTDPPPTSASPSSSPIPIVGGLLPALRTATNEPGRNHS